MDRAIAMDGPGQPGAGSLRDALLQGDAMLAGIGPILGHLLSAPDHSLFSDEIVARVRGMLSDLARQILRLQAEATGERGSDAFAERHGAALADHFQTCPALLSHCHALALEWQLTDRLKAQAGLDPVLSPLFQRLIGASDSASSSAAMAALAAQARFVQGQRRMELALAELPVDLLHETLVAWRGYCGETGSDAVARAETRIRQSYDESAGRLALFARLVSGPKGQEALVIEEAGAALFFSALAARSGQSRELAVLSSHERQAVRLALGLRAAGLEPERIDEVLLSLHPSAAPLAGLEEIEQVEARDLLADAANRVERG